MTLGFDPILECTCLHKTFPSPAENVMAVRGVSFAAHLGEFIVIYGPSGSGKTTLLNLLAGLDRADSGEVLFERKPFSTLGDRELTLIRRSRLGVIFQGFELVPVMTCFDNIEYPLILRRMPKGERYRRVMEVATLLGIDQLLSRRPAQISGGQKQRVAIARTLVCSPDIVLGDEISGNLDRKTALNLFETLKEMSRTAHRTFVVVTHDPELERYADTVFVMKDGRLLQEDMAHQ